MLKNHTCFFLFSSLMAWRGEMLYAATRMRFLLELAKHCEFGFSFRGCCPWHPADRPNHGPNHGQENSEKEEQETEVRCWLGLHQTVKSVLMSLSMLEKCSNVCVIDVALTNVSSQVQITSPTFSNHKFKHTFKKWQSCECKSTRFTCTWLSQQVLTKCIYKRYKKPNV